MLGYIPMVSMVSDSTFKHLLSWHHPCTDPPTIMNLTYHEENLTVTCVSTGSPATTVSWMKDEMPIDDSTHYTHTQTVTDRASSTYSNVLTVSEGAPGGVAGTYTCNVSNELGSDSDEVVAVGEFTIIRVIDTAVYIWTITFYI